MISFTPNDSIKVYHIWSFNEKVSKSFAWKQLRNDTRNVFLCSGLSRCVWNETDIKNTDEASKAKNLQF